MDSLCRKASRCLLGVHVPSLMSLTLSLLQSRLPITIRGHEKTHGLSTQSFPERGEINGEAHGSPPSMTRAPDGRTTPDPTTQGITLPQEPRGYQGLPSFMYLLLFHARSCNTSSSHWIAVPGPGWGWGWGPGLSCRTLRLHLAPGLPHPPVRCFIPRRFPLLLLKNARTILQRNKRPWKERSLGLVTFMQSKNWDFGLLGSCPWRLKTTGWSLGRVCVF